MSVPVMNIGKVRVRVMDREMAVQVRVWLAAVPIGPMAMSMMRVMHVGV